MLSSNKKKFIESWQKEVSQYMKEGNICRVVVAPLTPDHGDATMNTQSNSKLRALFEKPDAISGTFRQTQKKDSQEKLSYFHGYDTGQHVEKILPDDFTIVTNGRRSNGSRRQHSGSIRSGNKYSSGEPVVVDDHFDTKDLAILQSKKNKMYRRKSIKTAKEIYEKYTSIDPNYMDTQFNHHRTPPTLLSQIPWRNKTFLELPLRFSKGSGHYAGMDPHRSQIQIGIHRSNSIGRRIGSNPSDSIDPRSVFGDNNFFE